MTNSLQESLCEIHREKKEAICEIHKEKKEAICEIEHNETMVISRINREKLKVLNTINTEKLKALEEIRKAKSEEDINNIKDELLQKINYLFQMFYHSDSKTIMENYPIIS